MPKTSNLRAELISIERAGDKTFTITVTVWEAPGNKDSDHAIRFQFVTHSNPAVWWRLSMASARQASKPTRTQARYTNAQYNKAMRTATDALNEYMIREADELKAAVAGKELKKNPSGMSLKPMTYGMMPSEVDFLMRASDRFDSPFAFHMALNRLDSAKVERASNIAGIELYDRSGLTAVVSPRDMYKLIDALAFMGREFEDARAMDMASAMLQAAGFEWI